MYDAKNIEIISQLEPDTTYNGVIIYIEDGEIGQFVNDLSKWNDTTPLDKCIQITIEVIKDDKSIKINDIFKYNNDNGKTTFTQRSKLGKYYKKYAKAPEVGDKVKILADSNGYGKIII